MRKPDARTLTLALLPFVLACGSDSDRDTQAQQAASGLSATKVWEGPEPDFWSAKPSPDGRFISEIDWITGDLALIDLGSGELRRLTSKGTWADSDEWAETSVFSPDGLQIAYTWWNEEAPGYEIRVMNVDGPGVRTILPSPGSDFYAMLEGWTPDGQQILAMLWREEDKAEVGLISIDDGSVQVLRTWEGDDLATASSCDLSPDGRFVAYDPAPRGSPAMRDIVVTPAGGGQEQVVVEGPGEDLLMGWAPDGRAILFYGEGEAGRGIWMVPVTEGRSSGEPVFLWPQAERPDPIGRAGSAFFYGVYTRMPQVHTAPIDLQGNRLASEPTPVEDPSAGRSWRASWSADGRHFAYLRSSFVGSQDQALVVRSVTGEAPRVLEAGLERIGMTLGWSPDGRSLLVAGRETPEGPRGVYWIDLDSGEPELVIPEESIERAVNRTFELSRDGKTLFYGVRGEESEEEDPLWQEPLSVTARDLESGAESELSVVAGLVNAAVSPDGSTLALLTFDRSDRSTRLSILPTTGGEIRQLHEVQAPLMITANAGPTWTPDGEHLLFAIWNAESNQTQLWKMASSGGEPVPIEGLPESMSANELRLSPDGRHVSFTSGEGYGEIWKMESFPEAGVGGDADGER